VATFGDRPGSGRPAQIGAARRGMESGRSPDIDSGDMSPLHASLAAALLAVAAGSDGRRAAGAGEVACPGGWVDYDRPADFEPEGSAFRGLARQNLLILAISMSRSETPIFIQSGGGARNDPALSERRSAAVRDLLVSQGIDPDRVRVAPGKPGTRLGRRPPGLQPHRRGIAAEPHFARRPLIGRPLVVHMRGRPP
jgi:hypothetical protein